MGKSLLLLDTNRIKDYIFGTDELKEIRGASNILDRLNRSMMRRVVHSAGGTYCFAHGGVGLFIVETPQAPGLLEQVQRAYAQETGGAVTITGVTVPLPDGFDITQDNVQEHWKYIGHKLMLEKACTSDMYTVVTHPLIKHGASDGTFYATSTDNLGRLVSRVSNIKRQRSDELRRQAEQKGKHRPEDFNEIGAISSPQGYFALIYADGDGMGQVLEKCQTLYEIKKVAICVDAILRRAKRRATQHLPSQHFDTLFSGGDDLLLAVPAHEAVDIALAIAEYFYEHTQDLRLGTPGQQQRITLSTAIVWAHQNFPFGAWLDITESALKFAKQERAERKRANPHYSDPLINFLVISSANHLDFKRFYKEVLTQDNRDRLLRTLRPYTPATLRQLLSYRQAFQRLPRGKLEALRRALFASSLQQAVLDALRVLVHWRDDSTRDLMYKLVTDTHLIPQQVSNPRGPERAWFPFVEVEKGTSGTQVGKRTYVSPIADLAELWDFLPGDTDAY